MLFSDFSVRGGVGSGDEKQKTGHLIRKGWEGLPLLEKIEMKSLRGMDAEKKRKTSKFKTNKSRPKKQNMKASLSFWPMATFLMSLDISFFAPSIKPWIQEVISNSCISSRVEL